MSVVSDVIQFGDPTLMTPLCGQKGSGLASSQLAS